jgi:hypothetical protein
MDTTNNALISLSLMGYSIRLVDEDVRAQLVEGLAVLVGSGMGERAMRPMVVT